MSENKEQEILKKYDHKKAYLKILETGNTEIFTEDVLRLDNL